MVLDPSNHKSTDFHLQNGSQFFCLYKTVFPCIHLVNRSIVICHRIHCMEYSSDLSLCRFHTICHITISVIVIYRETDYISCSTFIAFRKLFILQKTTDCILCLFDKKKSIPLNRTNCHFPVTRTDQYFFSSVNRTFLC